MRRALRELGRRPGFHVLLAAVLGLGVGASSAMYGLVDRTLLHPLPYRDAERLVVISGAGIMRRDNGIAYWNQGPAFAALALERPGTAALGRGSGVQYVAAAAVTSQFFDVFQVHPALGRPFTEAESADSADVVALSQGVWRQAFGADPNVIGRKVAVGGKPMTVVAVMPPGFGYPGHTDLWLPTDNSSDGRSELGANRQEDVGSNGGSIGRLAAGVTLARAQAQVATLFANWVAHRPKGFGVPSEPRVRRLRDVLIRDYRGATWMLFAAVALMLLIACADAAGMMLARAAGREREMAIRMWLGARRRHLARELVGEGLALAALAGGLGVACAWGFIETIRRAGPGSVVGLRDLRLHATVTAVAVGLAVAVSLLASLAPLAGRPDRAKGPRARHSALVVVQFGLSLVLLLGALLALQTLWRLTSAPTGLQAQVTGTLSVHMDRPGDAGRILEQVAAQPGVAAAGLTDSLPTAGEAGYYYFSKLGGGSPACHDDCPALSAEVAGDYFGSMGIPVLAGRALPAEARADGPREIVVNDSFARKYYGSDQAAVGGVIVIPSQTRRIVGVVGDTAAIALGRAPEAEVYMPYAQAPRQGLDVAVVFRAKGRPGPVLAAVARGLHTAGLPVYNVRTMTEVLADSVATPRFRLLALAAFAALAVVLSLLGIYGLVSCLAASRTHEMGVRVVLGARRGGLVALVMGQGLRLAAAGVAIGLGAAWMLQRWLGAQNFGLARPGGAAAMGCAAALVGAAGLACLLPSLRASRVAPAEALRDE